MRVAVVGAGPAGLHFARLLKRARPEDTVDVFEQGPRGATWGFGVGLGGRVMREIEALDPDVHRAITAAMDFGDRQLIRLERDEFIIEYPEPLGAVARLDLLRILSSAAEDCGVRLRYDDQCEDGDRLAVAYDLVVAADGANSSLRAQRGAALGTCSYQLTNRFAWFGVARALRPMALVFRTFNGGTFIAHYYAYSESMSTFVAECDEAAWLRNGMDTMSNADRKSLFERIFAAELEGAILVDNRSVWRRFPVITNRRWSDGNLVLLGDSLQSAHFSIGSGTRLAMEDAAALYASVIDARSDIGAALARFEDIRRPTRDGFGEAARRSFTWYEQVAAHMNQPILDFIYGFLGRTGRIDDRRMQTYAPNFHAAYSSHRKAVGA